MDAIKWIQSGPVAVPVVNGVDLRLLVREPRLEGLDVSLVRPPSAMLLGGTEDETRLRTPLLACNCGEVGCASVTAQIRSERGKVFWDDIRGTRGEPAGVGPFVFARKPYDAARNALTSGSDV